MTFFLIIGGVGLAAIVLALVVGDVLDGILPDFDGGGVFSTPVIGAFLAAFGFGGALILNATDASTGIAALGGLGGGVVVGGLAAVVTRSVMNMPTDTTLRSEDLVGATGTVITRIPEGGMGEVSVAHQGQSLKLGARAAQSVDAGTPILVTAVTSSSSVVVTPNL